MGQGFKVDNSISAIPEVCLIAYSFQLAKWFYQGSPIVRVKDEVAMEIASIKAGEGQTIA